MRSILQSWDQRNLIKNIFIRDQNPSDESLLVERGAIPRFVRSVCECSNLIGNSFARGEKSIALTVKFNLTLGPLSHPLDKRIGRWPVAFNVFPRIRGDWISMGQHTSRRARSSYRPHVTAVRYLRN